MEKERRAAEVGKPFDWSPVEPFIRLLLVVAVAAVYATSVHGPFIFDDWRAILENASIRRWPPLWPPLGCAVSGRPVANLSLAINYALGGSNVWGYHVFNVGLHMLSALLLYGVARRTLRARFADGATAIAAAVSLLWATHPLNSESVDYVVQRTELLMGLFCLLSLYALIRSDSSPHPRRWQIVTVVSSALGMGSKEVMVVTPLLLLLYDRLFLVSSLGELAKKRAGFHAAVASTWLLLVALVMSTPRTATGFGLSITPWDYLKTEAGVLIHYLRLSVWPSPLVIDYYDWSIARTMASVAPFALLVCALLAVTGWALWHGARLGFLGAWFFLVLAPTSSILPSHGEVAAERRMYLPLAAVVMLAVLGGRAALSTLLHRMGSTSATKRWTPVALVAAIALTLAAVTIRRHQAFRSEIAIWQDTVDKRPLNARAQHNLGLGFMRQGLVAQAVAHSFEAVRLDPDDVEDRRDLGHALAVQGNIDEAIHQFEEGLRRAPNDIDLQTRLANVLIAIGRLEQALPHVEAIVRANPTDEAKAALADLRSRLGR